MSHISLGYNPSIASPTLGDTTVFDTSFTQLNYDNEKASCSTLYFTKWNDSELENLTILKVDFVSFFKSTLKQNDILGQILILLNKQTTKDEILSLYNVSNGTTPETHKETITYTIANLDDFKTALNRCSVLESSHTVGKKLQLIFNFSIASSASVSAFTQKVGFEFSMV